MKIIHAITMHLDRRDADTPVIDAVQGESGRVIALSLYEKGEPWIIPGDATVQIRYCKPDLTGGIYDSMPDGSKAWNFSDNTVTFSLPAQVLAAAGTVSMQVAITAEELELATFQFYIRVESDPSLGALDSEDYINIGQWLMAQILDAIERAEYARDVAIRAADDARATAAAVSSRMELNYTPVYTDPDTGEWLDSHISICSQVFPLLGGKLGVAFPKTVKVRLFYYNHNLDYLGADTVRYDSFEVSEPLGAFAVLEVRYASEMEVEDVEALARYVTVYVPNTSAQDAATAGLYALDALNYKNQAQLSAQRAEAAAEDAQNGTGIKTVNGIGPDENGNVSVPVGGGGGGITPHIGENGNWWIGETDTGTRAKGYSPYYRPVDVRFWQSGKMIVEFTPVGFPAGEAPSKNMECYCDFNMPEDGITPHIGDNGNWFIGEEDTGVSASGGGGGTKDWELVQSITTEENVSSVLITLPADNTYNEVYLTFRNNLVTDATGTTGGQAAATFYINDTAAITQDQLFLKAWSSTSALLTKDASDINVKWRKYATGTGGKVTEFSGGVFNVERMETITVALTDSGHIFTAGTIVEVYAR